MSAYVTVTGDETVVKTAISKVWKQTNSWYKSQWFINEISYDIVWSMCHFIRRPVRYVIREF